MLIAKEVKGFRASKNGFLFSNSFVDVPYHFHVLGMPIQLGHAYNGLCGGMIFTVCDLFYAGKLPPSSRFTPSHGPLFDYLCQRLLDSFALPLGPLNYYYWMNPSVRDTQSEKGGLSLAVYSRAWKMICQEWPKIKSEIDNGHLCTIGLILAKSWSPNDMGKNHQVLVHGYEQEGFALKLKIYDPNTPGDDGVSISINLADPTQGAQTVYASSRGKIQDALCFFKTNYRFKNPSGLMF